MKRDLDPQAPTPPEQTATPEETSITAEQTSNTPEPAPATAEQTSNTPEQATIALEQASATSETVPTPPEQANTPQTQGPVVYELPAAAGQAGTADERAALDSLDDTTMRPLVEVTGLWEPQRDLQTPPTPKGRVPRPRMIALVAGVAVVSFVAGGITARLTTQMPVLFAQEPAAHESPAAYEQTQLVAPVADEQEQQAEPELPEPTVDEREDATQAPHRQHEDTGESDDQRDNELRWDLDSEGDRSVGYDPSTNRVTMDYDGYSLTFTLDDLLSENDAATRNDSSDRSDSYDLEEYRTDSLTTDDQLYDRYDSYDLDTSERNQRTYGYPYRYNRTYGTDTGYDTEEERDAWVWGVRT